LSLEAPASQAGARLAFAPKIVRVGVSRRIITMPQETKPQKETVGRVMHEFKHGELRSGASGQKVKNPKQAIAIALSEAGASNQQSPKENAAHLRRTKAKERRGETAQAEAEGRGAKGSSSKRGRR
jgi:Family of unknown function (DUF6496)